MLEDGISQTQRKPLLVCVCIYFFDPAFKWNWTTQKWISLPSGYGCWIQITSPSVGLNPTSVFRLLYYFKLSRLLDYFISWSYPACWIISCNEVIQLVGLFHVMKLSSLLDYFM
jgi:hypothetical protein